MASRKRRFRPPVKDRWAIDEWVATCSCGKRSFNTRAAARKAARSLDGKHVATYECGGYYHWGHLKSRVIQGDSTVRVPGDAAPRQIRPGGQ